MTRKGVVIHIVTTDVLIVGAGPTGLTASVNLAKLGVAAIAISRYPGPAHTPRAHVTNQRTMEVFRDLGVEDDVKAVGYPLSYLRNNLMVTSLSGMEIARYKSYGTSAERLSDYAAASPCEGINAPQHVMEPALLDAARALGADVRYSHELVRIEQGRDGVVATIRERDTDHEYEIHAKYAIGADGARSTVAEQLGFNFQGEAGLRGMANSWLEVDLTEYTAHRPAVIYWVGRPGHEQWFGTASWINVRPWNEWSLLHPWPGDGLPSEDEVVAKARLTIGDPDIEIKVKAITKWYVNNVVATEYRKGRVFLAGDAAHRHPPTGGLGTNTSVQDAYNLCWKLALVLTGKAGEALLDSYHDERQPVGAHVVTRAITSFHYMTDLVNALGFREDQTEQEGWAALHEIYEDSPAGVTRRAALAAAIELQNYRSNGLGVELGQRYSSGAVIAEPDPFPEPAGDADLYYRPTTHTGAHLPHAWIEHERTEISTLDTVGDGRFSLIVGIGGQPWISAADKLSSELGIPITVVQIGLRCTYDDVVGQWAAIREVGDDGAVLVRPDRFVAWRAPDLSGEPADALRAALCAVLALEHRRPQTQRPTDKSLP